MIIPQCIDHELMAAFGELLAGRWTEEWELFVERRRVEGLPALAVEVYTVHHRVAGVQQVGTIVVVQLELGFVASAVVDIVAERIVVVGMVVELPAVHTSADNTAAVAALVGSWVLVVDIPVLEGLAVAENKVGGQGWP